MSWKDAWAKVRAMLGWVAPTPGAPALAKREQRMALPQTDRWSRMLKALQVAPHALMPALERELGRGMSAAERLLSLPKEGLFFDGLMVGKKIEALDRFSSELDPNAVRGRVMDKLPSLRDWALGTMAVGAITRSGNAETVAWARDGGHFEPGVLREALLAEAIEGGRSELARRELRDAGLERLESGQMDAYMEAFAARKASGQSEGLDSKALEAFAQSMGGWGELAEAAAGLGFEKLMDLVEHLMDAVAEEELVEQKLLEKTKAISSKRVRELIARALAAQAAKSDRPGAMRAALSSRADAMGVSVEKAAQSRIEQARVRVGKMDVSLGIEGGATLMEIARLSGASKAGKAAEAAGGGAISEKRLAALMDSAEKGVRSVVMRSSGEAREATKAWRETVKQWKDGVLEGASMEKMQQIVSEKIKAAEVEAPAQSAGRPKGP